MTASMLLSFGLAGELAGTFGLSETIWAVFLVSTGLIFLDTLHGLATDRTLIRDAVRHKLGLPPHEAPRSTDKEDLDP